MQHHLTSQQQGKKVGFGASRVQGTPKAARGSAGPPVRHPKEGLGLSREQLPLPRAVGRSSLHISLLPHTDKCWGPSCWDRATPMCQQPGCPRALQSTPGTFLKEIWCHQVAGTQVSPRAGPQAGDRPRLDSRTAQGRRLEPQAQGRGHFSALFSALLCRQGSALIPPGPSQFTSSLTTGLLLYIAHSEGPSGPRSYS